MWSGHCFSEVALWWQSRGSIGRAVSGNDCRIRAGADRGTEQKRKATQSAAGSGEYTFRSSVRLRYVKKTDTSAAYYEVLESQAGVVRMVFEMYTNNSSISERLHVC